MSTSTLTLIDGTNHLHDAMESANVFTTFADSRPKNIVAGIMNVEDDIVKIEWRGRYKTAESAFGSIDRAIKKKGAPVRLRKYKNCLFAFKEVRE